MSSYLDYFRALTKGIKYLQNVVGERLLAAFILPFDGLGDSARGGFFAALPNHPEQHVSSTDQVAKERLLIKFGNEGEAEWKSYVQNAWDTYGHFTTYQGVLAAVERWGTATFPLDWVPNTATLTEDSFANFTVNLPGSLPAFDIPHTFGDGLVYGQDALYGSSGSARSFALLRAAIRQAKPARSKGKVYMPFSSLPWSGVLLALTAGATQVKVSGTSASGYSLNLTIGSGGPRGTATFSWNLYDVNNVLIASGSGTTGASVALGSTGLTLAFASGSYTASDDYQSVFGFNVVKQLVINV